MYGNAYEDELLYYYCDICGRKVKEKDIIRRQSKDSTVVGWDGIERPKTEFVCKEHV